MQRFLKTFISILSIAGGAYLLFTAIRSIDKNTPRERVVTAKSLPPTAPVSNRSTDPGTSAAYIGGVGIVEPVGEATVIGSQLPGEIGRAHV